MVNKRRVKPVASIPGQDAVGHDETTTGPSGASIRQAKPGDAGRLIQLHFDTVQAVPEGVYSSSVLMSWSPTPSASRTAWMRERICSGSHVVLVAQLRHRICGFAIGALFESFIQAIYVHPQNARQQIGRSLLEAVEARLLHDGAQSCGVNASLNSVGFYTALGYDVIGQSTQKLGDGSEMSCYRMHRALVTAPAPGGISE